MPWPPTRNGLPPNGATILLALRRNTPIQETQNHQQFRTPCGVASARPVPAQSPPSARSSARPVPACKNPLFYQIRVFKERKNSIYFYFLKREIANMLCFSRRALGGHWDGHCTGTGRALSGHWGWANGTEDGSATGVRTLLLWGEESSGC